MSDARGDAQPLGGEFKPIEARDAVDVDQMAGAGEPHCHGRHQGLAAREHASVERGYGRQQGNGFLDRARGVIFEGGRFHEAASVC